MKPCIELVARDCGYGDWLGVVYIDGVEVYRSGKHLKGRLLAFESAMAWIDKQGVTP